MLRDSKRSSEHDEGDIGTSPAVADVDEAQIQNATVHQPDTMSSEDPNNPMRWPLWVKVERTCLLRAIG